MKFGSYVSGSRPFKGITDHNALVDQLNLHKPPGRLARWVMRLRNNNLQIAFLKGKEKFPSQPPFALSIRPNDTSNKFCIVRCGVTGDNHRCEEPSGRKPVVPAHKVWTALAEMASKISKSVNVRVMKNFDRETTHYDPNNDCVYYQAGVLTLHCSPPKL